MRERCEKSYCKDYTRYGGRGIKVHPSWQIFNNFAKDMGVRPDGATLDRIDNNGDYTPDNCRWVSHKEQTHNSRVCKLTAKKVSEIRETHAHGNITQDKLAIKYGVCQTSISRIINRKIW